VKESMDVFGLTGVSIGVIEKDKVVFRDGFGYADKERGIPATDQTHYHIASMSKAFTSMLLAIYADDPMVKLNLDVPVRSEGVFYDSNNDQMSPLFPEWKMDDDEATLGATLRDMLNHRTGLPRHDFLGVILAKSKEDLLHKLAGLESNQPFRTAPGEYNNIMFALAGLAAERLEASKVSSSSSSPQPQLWEDLVTSKIFDVLNMTDTFSSIEAFGDRKTLARGYAQGIPMPEELNNLHNVTTPAGGIISNVNDLLKWAQLHLRQWDKLSQKNQKRKDDDNEQQLLVSNKAYLQNFVQSQTVFPLYNMQDTYCNGWWHSALHGSGNLLVHHGGNLHGFSLAIGLLPNPIKEVGNSAVVVLTNEDNSVARDSLLIKLSLLLQERAGYSVPAATKIDWDQLFFQAMQKNDAAEIAEDKAIEDKIANTPAEGKAPLLDLGAYVGSYVEVKGSYGRIDITKKQVSKGHSVLYLTMKNLPWQEGGAISSLLGHMYFESFRFCDPEYPDHCENNVRIEFENDGYGVVTAMNLYGVEDVVLRCAKIASSVENSSISDAIDSSVE